MEELFDVVMNLMNPQYILTYGGLFLLLAVLFAENGLFFAFFLPGDSLLFTTGLFCAIGTLPHPLWLLLLSMFVVSFLGYTFAYYFGVRSGKLLLRREESVFFKRRYIAMARAYYRKFGGKTLLIARYLPIIRTFAPIMAGMVQMSQRSFFFYNLLGSFLWIMTIVNAGYFFGKMIPTPEKYLNYIVLGLVVVTAIPIIQSFFKKKPQLKQKNNR
ncbi:MAG: DedA family protein [Cytophagales bacterium]|nr:MAG: DedA family protein [Cytophagales bacterium]TAF60250.1 MAG: DedA family protein [Cytophagales bacterium]